MTESNDRAETQAEATSTATRERAPRPYQAPFRYAVGRATGLVQGQGSHVTDGIGTGSYIYKH